MVCARCIRLMYVELHARSAFSFLEGASIPEELASVCHTLGMPSMALLDRDGLYGAPRFHLCAEKAGIRTHIGAEVSCTQGWRYPLLVTSPEGYKHLCPIFGRNNVYVELQRHFSIEEERRNQVAVELARDLRLPLLATNGVCHALPPQREILDVFTCLRNHKVLANAGRLLSCNSERYLKSPVQMAALFADLPDAIANTTELASRLKFTLKD